MCCHQDGWVLCQCSSPTRAVGFEILQRDKVSPSLGASIYMQCSQNSVLWAWYKLEHCYWTVWRKGFCKLKVVWNLVINTEVSGQSDPSASPCLGKWLHPYTSVHLVTNRLLLFSKRQEKHLAFTRSSWDSWKGSLWLSPTGSPPSLSFISTVHVMWCQSAQVRHWLWLVIVCPGSGQAWMWGGMAGAGFLACTGRLWEALMCLVSAALAVLSSQLKGML